MRLMDLANAALLLIDMQQAFDSSPWPKRWNDSLDRNGLAILAAWRRSTKPVLHARHDSIVPGSTLAPSHVGHRFRSGFDPLPEEPIIPKSVNAAFIGTDLDLRLRRLGVGTVVTFGISTDMCVSTTVRVGSNLGWRMVLIEDACDCFDLPSGDTLISARAVHAAHVATLGFEFCDVVRTADILRLLQP
jgi:nicotinamidase-related amidase